MSTPHCSFVIYLNKDAALVSPFLQDLRSFFQKFPLTYELVAVVEKEALDCSQILETAQKDPAKKELLTILKNDRTLHRAESLRQGLNKAQASYLVIADPQMATPLGDIFKILQNLMTEPTLDICWGNRLSKKENPFLKAQTPRHRLEHLFNGILHERNKISKDPLCEIGGFRKEAWARLQESDPSPLRGWYLNPQLLQRLLKMSLNRIEIPIHDSGQTSASYNLWRERWNLLRQGIF